MTLTTIETQFITLIKAAISGGTYLPEETDYPDLFTLDNQKKLLRSSLSITDSCMPVGGENVQLFAAMKQQVIARMMTQTMCVVEFSEYYKSLLAMGLYPIVVKGQLCSRLYPLKVRFISAVDNLLHTVKFLLLFNDFSSPFTAGQGLNFLAC